jgi:hypothetical protein
LGFSLRGFLLCVAPYALSSAVPLMRLAFTPRRDAPLQGFSHHPESRSHDPVINRTASGDPPGLSPLRGFLLRWLVARSRPHPLSRFLN